MAVSTPSTTLPDRSRDVKYSRNERNSDCKFTVDDRDIRVVADELVRINEVRSGQQGGPGRRWKWAMTATLDNRYAGGWMSPHYAD